MKKLLGILLLLIMLTEIVYQNSQGVVVEEKQTTYCSEYSVIGDIVC